MRQLIVFEKLKNQLDSPLKVFQNVKKINIDHDQENFLVIYLNVKNQVINSEVVFKGCSNACLIDPKIIFRKALINKAEKIIIAHNHPSGYLEPSKEDLECFKGLKELGNKLSLPVLDSIIFNKKEFFSLYDSNYLDQLNEEVSE